jgi:hypothetical protein
MAIVKFSPGSLEYFDLEVHHNRTFSSGSNPSKITSGSLRVFPRGSKIEKMRALEDIYTPFNEGAVGTTNAGWQGQSTAQTVAKYYLGRTWSQVLVLSPTKLKDLSDGIANITTASLNLKNEFSHINKFDLESGVLSDINKSSANIKATKKINIKKFRPTTNARFLSSPGSRYMNQEFEPSPAEKVAGVAVVTGLEGEIGLTRRNKVLKTFGKKFAFINALSTHKMTHPDTAYGFSNYTCLNFFTGGMVPSDSVFIYPNLETRVNYDKSFASGCYTVYGGFTFDFYINPRYGFEKAGTLFHLSSSYALSLVTGSHKNNKDEPSGFKLLLQLSHSADVPPSEVTFGSLHPNDLVFTSSNNALKRNHWHHVSIRWGDNINASTGSFNIDGVEKGTFAVPSASIVPLSSMTTGNPNCLYVGNYYEGTN